MSTGLSGEQLDALRETLYADMVAADAESDRLWQDYQTVGKANGWGHHKTTAAREDYLKHTRTSQVLALALRRIDNARRSAAQSKVGSKR